MALPTLVSSSTLAEGTNGTTHNVPVPTSLSAGNWFVMIVGVDGATTVTPPAGWTQVFFRTNVDAVVQAGVYIKEVTGSESGNFAFTTSGSEMMSAWCGQYSGVDDSVSIIEAFSFSYGEQSGTGKIHCPMAYSATADCLVLHAAVSDGGSAATLTDPSGDSAVTTQISSSSAGVSLRISSTSVSNDYVPQAYFANASTGDESCGFTLLIRSSASETFPAQPVIKEVQYVQPTASSGAATFDAPFGIDANDLLVALRTSNSTSAYTAMSGFTSLFTLDVGGVAACTKVDYKKATGSETGTIGCYDSAGSAQHAVLLRIINCDTTTPVNTSHSSTGTSTTPNDTGVTPSVDNCLLLWLCGADDDDNTYDTNYPSGWTGIISTENNEGLDSTLIAAYKTQTTAAATGTVTGALDASEQWAVAMVAVAPAAGVTTYTKTASLNALLKKQDVLKTASLGALVKKSETETASLGAILKKAVTVAASLDSALKKAATKTASLGALAKKTDVSVSASIDGVLAKFYTVSVSTDATLKKTVTVSANVSGLLKKTVSVSGSLDAHLKKALTVSGSLDARLVARLTSTASVGALLKKSNLATTSLGALLKKSVSVDADIDALLKKSASLSLSLDAILEASASTGEVSANINALLKKVLTVTASLGALLKSTETATVSMDALLKKAQSNVVSIDAYLRKTRTSTASADALLEKVQSVTASLNALAKKAGVTSTALIDAALKNDVVISASLDSRLMKAFAVTALLGAILEKTAAVNVGIAALLKGGALVTCGLNAILIVPVTAPTGRTFSKGAAEGFAANGRDNFGAGAAETFNRTRVRTFTKTR